MCSSSARCEDAPTWNYKRRPGSILKKDHSTLSTPRIIRLDKNENPRRPPPGVLEAVFKAVDSINRYPSQREIDELKARIASYCRVGCETIVLGAGADGIIDLAVRSTITPGDQSVVARPTFEVYELAGRMYGSKIEHVQLRRRTYTLPIDDVLERAAKSKLVFIANPNNPTGNLLLDRRTAKEILSVTRGILVVDEVYYEYSGCTLADLTKDYPNLIIVRTFSKAFGLAGARIGYAIASEETVKLLEGAKLPFDVTSLSIRAASAALENLEYVERTVEETLRERRRVSEELRKLGLRVYPSSANFLMFSSRPAGVTSTEMVNSLLNRGVLIRDLSGVKGLGRYYSRVSIGMRHENTAFLKALREVLEP